MKLSGAPARIVAGTAALGALPWLHLPAFYESFLYLLFYWVVLATSWNLLSGYAGYFSFGHGAFFGAGTYTTAVLAGRFDWPFLWTLPAALVVSAALGAALGAVAFRVKGVRGEVFALLTLAVTFVLATIVLNTPIDGGPGVYLNSVPVPQIGPTPPSSFYLLALAAASAALLIAWGVQHSRFGGALFAIHDDEDAAEVMGVPTYRVKLAAFSLSCALAGLVGGIHALFVSYVTAPEVFSITVPLTVVLMSVLGGTRHWAGPAVGAVAITCLLYAFTASDHALAGKALTGVILVVAILHMPDGILAFVQRWTPRKAEKAVDGGHDTAASSAAVRTGEPIAAYAGAGTTALLRVRGLRKSFQGVEALAGVDIDVRGGEILGLLGPNGSGKSTFINVVSGHYLPSGGEAVLEGVNLAGRPAHRIARAGIARTYQIPRPFKHLSVLDNVAVAAMYGCAGARGVDEGRAQAREWLRFTHLENKEHARPDDLNLHQRKFLELARALAARPKLLFLDEVLCGLTPGEIQDAVAMIRRIRDHGTTIVFVEHVLDAVMALTDRIVVFNQGRVLAQGDAQEVMRQPEVMSAYLGVAHA
jgi:branched-chain amino acid transport system permease protein